MILIQQVDRAGAYVTHLQNPVRSKLILQVDVVLPSQWRVKRHVDGGRVEGGIRRWTSEALRLASAEIHPARGKGAKRRGRIRVGVVEGERSAAAVIQRDGVGITLLQAVHESSAADAIVEHAHSATNHQLAVLGGLPGKPEA